MDSTRVITPISELDREQLRELLHMHIDRWRRRRPPIDVLEPIIG